MIDKEKLIELYKNGLKQKDIAKELNCSVASVKMCLKRDYPELQKQKKEKDKAENLVGYNAKTEPYFDFKFKGNNPFVGNLSDYALLKCCRSRYMTAIEDDDNVDRGDLILIEDGCGNPYDMPRTIKPVLI